MLTKEQLDEAKEEIGKGIDKVLRNLSDEQIRIDWLREYAVGMTIQKNMYKLAYDLNLNYMPDGITMKVKET